MTTWLPTRAGVPVIDNWPPKPLSIYANLVYGRSDSMTETEPTVPEAPSAPDDTPAEPSDDEITTEPQTPPPAEPTDA